MPVLRVVRAGLDDYLVEFEEGVTLGAVVHLGGQFRELLTVAAHGKLVENLAEAVDVGLWRGGRLRGAEAVGANNGVGLGDRSDEADVGETGLPILKDDVGGLDVAVNEAMPVKVDEGFSEGMANLDALTDREASVVGQLGGECARSVMLRINLAPGELVVRRLHDVIEKSAVVAANMEDVEQVRVRAGHRFGMLDACEFSFEGTLGGETGSVDNLDSAPSTGDGAGEPDIAIGAGCKTMQEIQIGNLGWLSLTAIPTRRHNRWLGWASEAKLVSVPPVR